VRRDLTRGVSRAGAVGLSLLALTTGCGLAPLRPVVPAPAAPLAAPSASPVSTAAPAAASPAAASPAAADTVTRVTAAAVRDEVVDAAAAVFGDTTGVADLAAVAGPSWDIDVLSYETHDRVAHYVNLFTGTARERFTTRLSRGTRYDAMIRAKLRASGMPEDLIYLALIESGFDPDAYSRAAAVGMWQFMSSTARDVGLRVDWWMDERRDPARSTDGAIKFLGFLQKQFGSLYLAAAAYNGGPGRVARGLTRFADELEGINGEDRFFALAEQDYLRAETRNYVPQLIAAALVAKTPARYGLPVDSQPAYVYDSVLVEAGTRLAAVAEAGGVERSVLRELNPAVLRGITPPDAAIWVRVPVGAADSIRAALDSMDLERRAGFREVTVSTAATPTAFAAKHDVSVRHLRWYNPSMRTAKSGRLVTGQRLRVPHADAIALARELPDPGIERYGPTAASSSRAGVHVVRRGETLGGIARRYGLSEAQLRSLNSMRGSRILAGQSLVVRRASSASRATSARATSSARTKSTPKAKSTSKAKSTAKAKSTGKAKSTAKGRGSSKPKPTASTTRTTAKTKKPTSR